LVVHPARTAVRLLLAATVLAAVTASVSAQPTPARRGSPAPAALDRTVFPFFPLQSAWLADNGVPPGPGVGIGDGRVFVGFTNGDMGAYDIVTGQLRWARHISATRPLAVEGSRLFVAGDKVIDGLRTSDGTSEWQTPLRAAARTGPVVRGGWLLAGLEDGSVTALRTDTGAVVWTIALGTPAPVAPVVEGDRFYAATTGAGLHARTIATGAPIWQVALDGDVTALAAVEGHVFAATAGRWLYALDAARGRVNWRFRIQGAAIGLTVDDDRVVAVMLDQSVRAFKIGTGAQAWRQELAFRPAGGPVVTGGSVLVTGFAPSVRAIDRKTGANQGVYAIPLPVDASGISLETLSAGPLVATGATVFDDVVVLVTQHGLLNGARRAFDPPVSPITALPGTVLAVPAPPPGMPAADPPPSDPPPAGPPAAEPPPSSPPPADPPAPAAPPAGDTPPRTPPAPPAR
jgi:outer membrane protein assembly factor BamB